MTAIEKMLPSDDQKVADFLRDLTELSRKHRLALAGEPILFEMEREDFDTEYLDHPDGTVTFG